MNLLQNIPAWDSRLQLDVQKERSGQLTVQAICLARWRCQPAKCKWKQHRQDNCRERIISSQTRGGGGAIPSDRLRPSFAYPDRLGTSHTPKKSASILTTHGVHVATWSRCTSECNTAGVTMQGLLGQAQLTGLEHQNRLYIRAACDRIDCIG